MRDLLPEEARKRRSLGRTILDHFGLHGYELVTPPAFELAEVLEKGLGALDPGDVLRFVEPESGEVCALRPDMTPQIARMVATRLAEEPLPLRLAYEGTVLRRRQGRAKKHRQIPQAGVELYGAPNPEGDLEALRLLASVARATGLQGFVIDVGHAQIARSLVACLPSSLADDVTAGLVQKDNAALEALFVSSRAHNVNAKIATALVEIVGLSGGGAERPGDEVLEKGRSLLAGTPAESPLQELTSLWSTALLPRQTQAGGPNDSLEGVLRLDLGEVRGFAYYTGAIFHVLAPGASEPVGAGGRYDDLLGRFGVPMSAVGFGLNLDMISRAREALGVHETKPLRVVVMDDVRGEALTQILRARTIAACRLGPGQDVLRYAAAHHFTHAVSNTSGDDGQIHVVCLDDPALSRRFSKDVDMEQLVSAIIQPNAR